MLRIFLFSISIFIFASAIKSEAIVLSTKSEISVLTCGSSKMLHAMYGHTAIRVNDPQQLLDIVFNYGVFSFSEPNFAYRFAKGQTDYLLAIEQFSNFYKGYKRRGRSIDEQVLNLSDSEKQRLLDFLIENAKPENREYRYNFFMDNCATRVRDVIEKQVDGEIKFPTENGLGKTFRQHVTVCQKVLPWTNLGIQLTLGSPADKLATAYQEMFLPDFLKTHFAEARINTGNKSRPLIKETHSIYDSGERKSVGIGLFSPIVILLLTLTLVGWISFRQFRKKQLNYWIDYILLFITGLIGFGLLWFVTFSEHPAMHPNYHLLWAIPSNLLFIFLWMIKKWRPVLKWYWIILTIWMTLFIALNFMLPQSFNIGFYLICLMVLCRSALHSSYYFTNYGK